MSLAGCQINPINVNFHLQKSLEIFDTNSADKIQSQNYKGDKNALPHARNWLNFCIDLYFGFYVLLSAKSTLN